jgi:hypothetical protein
VPGVFLNYRNTDGEGWAAFLDFRLRTEFGGDAVFRASRSILPAEDYVQRLLHAVRNCSVLLSVIGPGWETMVGRDGRRRLENENDWVRRELAEALSHEIPVIPVLLGTARPLTEDRLPAEISPLAKRQYMRLGHRNDEADIARIIEELRRLAPDLGRAEPGDRSYHLPPRSRPGPSGLLTGAERYTLLAEFHATDWLRDRDRRQGYLERAERWLGRPIPFPRGETDRDDIDALVTACLDQPGALYALMSVLVADHPGSPDAATLHRAVSSTVPAPWLTGAERRTLDRSTGGIDQVTAVRVFHHTFGVSPPPLRHHPTDLPTIVAELEEAVSRPGEIPPLLRYLEYLAAAEVGSLVAITLRELVVEISTRIRVESGSIEGLQRQIGEEGAMSTFLVIQLQPDGASDDRYLISVTIQRGAGPGRSLGQPEEPLTIAQIKDYIDQLLTDDADLTHLVDEDDLWVEFVLPRALLDADVDQWEFGKPIGFARTLGTYYRVTVRSLERQQRSDLRRAWRARCRQLPSWADARFDDAVHWIPTAGGVAKSLLAELQLQDKAACVAFGFAPEARRDLGSDEYAVGLYAGIPVMVWGRDPRDPAGFRSLVQDLVDAGGVAEIPEHARRLRLEATRAGSDAKLTVLFEPPRLAAPRGPYVLRSPA